ncbi:hypothetical protein C0Q70_01361 [Pomacea canaliculata]|uniref:Uncharacterized protein n=1 Tax=Pomacea canaliculata TaxID=400727 RepID=A0A2T7PZA5_POMCA|nr:hypothetical protein C0Q70_01361 [Pomacea canaliculata]
MLTSINTSAATSKSRTTTSMQKWPMVTRCHKQTVTHLHAGLANVTSVGELGWWRPGTTTEDRREATCYLSGGVDKSASVAVTYTVLPAYLVCAGDSGQSYLRASPRHTEAVDRHVDLCLHSSPLFCKMPSSPSFCEIQSSLLLGAVQSTFLWNDRYDHRYRRETGGLSWVARPSDGWPCEQLFPTSSPEGRGTTSRKEHSIAWQDDQRGHSDDDDDTAHSQQAAPHRSVANCQPWPAASDGGGGGGDGGDGGGDDVELL